MSSVTKKRTLQFIGLYFLSLLVVGLAMLASRGVVYFLHHLLS